MPRARNWIVRRKKALEEWIEDVKPLLGLADWTITVNWHGNHLTHPSAGEELAALATMTPLPSSKHASMTVSRELLDCSPRELHQTLVHELVHCHLFALHDYSLESFEEAAGKNKLALGLYRNNLTDHVERTTDALADAFSRMLPAVNLD